MHPWDTGRNQGVHRLQGSRTMIKDDQRHQLDDPKRHGYAGHRLRALEEGPTWHGQAVSPVQKKVQPHQRRISLMYLQRDYAFFQAKLIPPAIIWPLPDGDAPESTRMERVDYDCRAAMC